MSEFQQDIDALRRYASTVLDEIAKANQSQCTFKQAKGTADKVQASDKDKVSMFLGSLANSFKKSSEEYKYCSTLMKNFEEMNVESIKFFISTNYDRFDEIRNMIKKYDDNFNVKETARYEARHTVLSKVMMYLLQENI